MRQLTADHLTALRTSHEPPCISLYQPTHRAHPDNLQDPRSATGISGATWKLP